MSMPTVAPDLPITGSGVPVVFTQTVMTMWSPGFTASMPQSWSTAREGPVCILKVTAPLCMFAGVVSEYTLSAGIMFHEESLRQ